MRRSCRRREGPSDHRQRGSAVSESHHEDGPSGVPLRGSGLYADATRKVRPRPTGKRGVCSRSSFEEQPREGSPGPGSVELRGRPRLEKEGMCPDSQQRPEQLWRLGIPRPKGAPRAPHDSVEMKATAVAVATLQARTGGSRLRLRRRGKPTRRERRARAGDKAVRAGVRAAAGAAELTPTD